MFLLLAMLFALMWREHGHGEWAGPSTMSCCIVSVLSVLAHMTFFSTCRVRFSPGGTIESIC